MAINYQNTQYSRIFNRTFTGVSVLPNYNGNDFTITPHNPNDVQDSEIIINSTDKKAWVCFGSGGTDIKEISFGGGGGGSYTFSNGLTEASGVVKLGGALTSSTFIGLGGNVLCFGTPATTFNANFSDGGFILNDNGVNNNQLLFSASGLQFKSLGGKVYILDTGSKDNTVQVAKQWGCHVEEVGDKFRITINKELADQINAFTGTQIVKDRDSVFDYASARNYIANFATHDMIATPDCDEIWTKFNIDKINQAVEQADQLEYNFVFAHDENGKELVKFLHSKFYNRNKMKWVGIIHEVLQGEGKRLFLDESIIKLEHWQNPETNRSGYLPGLAIDCYTNQDNDRNAHYFGRELMYHGYFEAAIKQLDRHIAMDKWPTERSQSMIFIGDCLQYMNKFDASWYLKAFDLEPNRREPLMKLAEYYYQQGKKEQTRAYGEAALTIQGNNFYANYQPYYEDRPHELLYWAWDGVDKIKSDYHWDQVYKINPKKATCSI